MNWNVFKMISMTCNFCQDVPRYTFGRYESIKLPVKSTFERITIDPKLAAKINPIEVRPGIAVASITGNLVVTNNK